MFNSFLIGETLTDLRLFFLIVLLNNLVFEDSSEKAYDSEFISSFRAQL